MLLFVGLGNPGPKYAHHRHNIGYAALDEIMRRYRFAAPRRRFEGRIAEGEVAGTRILALKPETFMNESGRSVGQAMRYYKLAPSDVVVFYDELDLAPGKVRVRRGGGTAGHNGIRSLDRHIGNEFRRVRIGIGHPGDKRRVQRHVLSDFAKADAEWVEKTVDAIADAAPFLVDGDDPGFMNKVALLTQPQREKPPRRAPAPDTEA